MSPVATAALGRSMTGTLIWASSLKVTRVSLCGLLGDGPLKGLLPWEMRKGSSGLCSGAVGGSAVKGLWKT